MLLGLVAFAAAAAVGVVVPRSNDEATKTPLTVTDCEGPVRLILSREEAIAFLKERGAKSYALSGPFNRPPGEKVVIELRERPPGQPTPYAPVDPLQTDC